MPLKHRPRSTFTKRPVRILVLSNTPQNDWLGRDLISALKKQEPRAAFFGLGGAGMRQAGLSNLPNMPLEVNFQALNRLTRGHAFNNYLYKKAILRQCAEKNIEAVVTIGPAPLFVPLARSLSGKLNIPCFHYGDVAPAPAGYPGKLMLKALQGYRHVFCFYPFQATRLKEEGVAASFVGHPLLAHFAEFIPSGEAKPMGKPRSLALMPGRRGQTIRQVTPAVAEVAMGLQQTHEDLQLVLPLANATNPRHFEPYSQLRARYARGEEKHRTTSRCDAAIALAGENNLPLALFGVPMVAIRNPSLFQRLCGLLRRREGPASPVNKLLGVDVVPEVNIHDTSALLEKVAGLLENTEQRKEQLAAFKKVRVALRPPEDKPIHEVAAGVILEKI